MTSERDFGEVRGLVYGVTIDGTLPLDFQAYLSAPIDIPALPAREVNVMYEVVTELSQVDEIWASETKDPQDNRRFALFSQSGGFGLEVDGDGQGLFRIRPESIEIEWLPGNKGAAHHFFSYALPLWLESQGMPVLHASAVSFGDWAAAFIAPSGMGKSTLCAGLVRSGCDFLADDELSLQRHEDGDWHCHHGPPFSRLWPSALEQRLGIFADRLPRVYESREKRRLSLANEDSRPRVSSVPLRAIYLLERRPESNGHIRISPCTAAESLIHLIEHSLAATQVALLGWSESRFDKLASVVGVARVKRLSYPESGDLWPIIREVIVEDRQSSL